MGITEKVKNRIIFNIPLLLHCAILTCLSSSYSRDNLQTDHLFSFEQIQFLDGVLHQVFADFDGDGNEEYIYTSVEKGALLIDFDGPDAQTVCHLVGSLKVGRFQALNFIGDPSPEIFLPVKKGNEAWIEIYKVTSSFEGIECSFIQRTESVSGFDYDHDGEWDVELMNFQVLDVNEDGQKDILTCAITGRDKNPRGVLAFDGKTGKKLWEFPTAGHPCNLNCVDVNNDGRMEIVFGTWAPDNGNIIGDMDDSHCYLICLTDKGQLLWKYEIGGKFSGINYITEDVNNDGKNEIICTYASGDDTDKTTTYELQIRNGITGEVERYFRLPTKFYQPFLADFDRDGKNEILVTNDNGYIYVFNENLELLRKTQLGTNLEKCTINEIVDINQDGMQEIIVCVANKLLILDDQLKILGKYKTGMYIAKVHYFEHPNYGGLIALSQSYLDEFRNSILLKVRFKTDIPKLVHSTKNEYSLAFLLAMFVLGMGATFLGLKIVPPFFKIMKPSSPHRKNEHRDSLLETLSVFGHGKTATENLDRLSLLFKNLPNDEPLSVEYRKRIDESITTFFKFTSHQFEDILKRSKSAEIGLRHLESLHKNIRQLESLLLECQKEGFSKNQAEKFSEEIPATLESLDNIVESIKEEIAHFYSTDVSSEAKEVLAALSPDLRKENIKLKNLIIEGDIDAKGFIGRSDFANVFEELVRNAIFSMNRTLKEIIINILITENKIFIEITDTGCGIKQDDIDKIFDREYSTKKEGGFGLYHAKIIVNKYGGKIKVAKTEPGNGTTMRIEIKRV